MIDRSTRHRLFASALAATLAAGAVPACVEEEASAPEEPAGAVTQPNLYSFPIWVIRTLICTTKYHKLRDAEKTKCLNAGFRWDQDTADAIDLVNAGICGTVGGRFTLKDYAKACLGAPALKAVKKDRNPICVSEQYADVGTVSFADYDCELIECTDPDDCESDFECLNGDLAPCDGDAPADDPSTGDPPVGDPAPVGDPPGFPTTIADSPHAP